MVVKKTDKQYSIFFSIASIPYLKEWLPEWCLMLCSSIPLTFI